MPSEYQQDYKKTHAYTPKIYNDPNMTNELKDVYRALKSRYVHEGRTIDPSFYQDLNDESLAKFTNIGFDCLLFLDEQICLRTMSSPDHSTSNNKDAFSSNIPNYVSTIPDYSPASSGKTYQMLRIIQSELAILCPNIVPKTEKLMEAFIGGLPRSIEGNITASKPQTLNEAINIAQRLMDQIIKHNSTQETNDNKQKFEDRRNTIHNNNYLNDLNNNNHSNNHNHNNDYHHQQNKKQETFKTYVATNGYTGNRPLCERCTLHHVGPCSVKCQNCNRVGHLTKNCRNRNNPQPVSVTCNTCGEKGHYANQCSKANNRATRKHT
nr:hypothetical protein [Tanacetum cinerariifolium]